MKLLAPLVLLATFASACTPEDVVDPVNQAEVAEARHAFTAAVTAVTAKVFQTVVDPTIITAPTAPPVAMQALSSETRTINTAKGGVTTKGTITITQESATKVTIAVKLSSSWSAHATDGVATFDSTSGNETIDGTLTFELDETGESVAYSAALNSAGTTTDDGKTYQFDVHITAAQNGDTNEMVISGTVHGEPFTATLTMPETVRYVRTDGRLLACYDGAGCFEYTGSAYSAPTFKAQCFGGGITVARCPRDFVHRCTSPSGENAYADYYYESFDASKYSYLASICPGTWE